MVRQFLFPAVCLLTLFPLPCLRAQGPEASFKGKPISHWVRKLQDRSVEARREAVLALGGVGPEAATAVPALLKAIEDDDDEVREDAVRALGKIGPGARSAVPTLLEALQDRDPNFRRIAIEALGGIGPEARTSVPQLLQAYEPGKGANEIQTLELRVAICKALGGIGPGARAAVPKLIEVQNQDQRIATAAGEALSRIGADAVPDLLKAMKSPNLVLQARAPDILGNIGASAVPALLAELKDTKSSIRVSVVTALGRIGPGAKPGIPALIEALSEPGLMGTAAAEALSRMGPEAAPFLMKELRHANDAVAELAVQSLQKLGPDLKASAPALVELLKHGDSKSPVRGRASRVLVHLGTDAVPSLTAALSDKDNEQVLPVLISLGPRVKGAMPDLMKMLEQKDPRLRRQAAMVLGAIGPEGKAAIPALADLLQDPDAEVRRAALDALRKIVPVK